MDKYSRRQEHSADNDGFLDKDGIVEGPLIESLRREEN